MGPRHSGRAVGGILLVIIRAMVFSLIFCSLVQAKVVTLKEVEGNGQTREKAVEDALRTAIEQVCGVYIESQTTVKLYQLIDDTILTETSGYVKSYKILNESKDSSNMVTVKIQAEVATDKETMFRLLKLMLGDRMARVSVDEYIAAERSVDPIILPALQQTLIQKNYVLMTDEYKDTLLTITGSVKVKAKKSQLQSKGLTVVALDSCILTVTDSTGRKIAIITQRDLTNVNPGGGNDVTEAGREALTFVADNLKEILPDKLPAAQIKEGE